MAAVWLAAYYISPGSCLIGSLVYLTWQLSDWHHIMPHLTTVCHDSWHSHRVCHRHWGHTAQTFQPWIYKYIEEKKYLRDNVTRKVWYFIIWGVAFGINYCSWRGFTFLRYSDKGLLTSRSLLLHARHFGLRHWACVKQYKCDTTSKISQPPSRQRFGTRHANTLRYRYIYELLCMSDIGQHLKLPIQSTATKGAINFSVTVNNEHQRVGPDYFFSPVACRVKTYFQPLT